MTNAMEQTNRRDARRSDEDDRIDAALLERIVGGDREALSALYSRYYHELLRFVYRVTGDAESAQEGVNDVMLVVWRNAANFAGRSRVSTWIMGIAYRKALKSLDISRRWRTRFKAAEWSENIEPSGSGEGLTDDRALRELVHNAMQQLPPKQRAVVELTYVHECSYEEIAAIVGCPVNTVKTRMFHARAKLRRALGMLRREDLFP